jgi:hypothetical protein
VNAQRTKWVLIVYVVFILNGLIFVVLATYLGGDAINGKSEGGHYYLYGVRSESGHKVYTEVSESLFRYSKWHAYSIFILSPVFAEALMVDHRRRKRLQNG